MPKNKSISKRLKAKINTILEFTLIEKYLVIVIVMLLGWLLYYNVVTAYHIMDSDVVVDSILIPKIIGERGLFFNDHIFGHEPMFSRPFIVTMFMRLFTDDWIMAVKIGITITTVIIISLFYTLCRRVNLSRTAGFLGIVFLLGTNVSIFNNFRAANFYPTFVIIPLLVCILLVDIKKSEYSFKGKENLKNKIKLISLFIIALLSGFFGIRMTAILFIPLVAVEFFYFLANIRGKEKALPALKNQKAFFTSLGLFVINVSGLYIVSKYNTYAEAYVPASTYVHPSDKIFEEFLPKIRGSLLNTLSIPSGGMGSSDILKLAELVLRVGIIVIAIFAVVYTIRKGYKNEITIPKDDTDSDNVNGVIETLEITEIPEDLETLEIPKTSEVANITSDKVNDRNTVAFVAAFFLASFVIVAIIMTMIGQLSPKYFYFVWYLLAFGVSCAVDKGVVKTSLYRSGFSIFVAMACIVSISNYDIKQVSEVKEKDLNDITSYAIAQYLKENDYDRVFADFWDSALIGSYTNMEVGAGYFNNKPFKGSMWAVDKEVYYDTSEGKYAVVIGEKAMKEVLDNAPKFKRDFIEQNLKLVNTIGHLDIYETRINPLPAFKMPKFKGEKNTYHFSQNYAEKSDNAIVSFDGDYIENKLTNTELIAYGSYQRMLKGEYQLTVNYEYLGEGDPSKFIISATGVGNITSETLSLSETSYAFKFNAEDHLENTEFKIESNSAKIRVKSVEIEKIG